MPMGRINPIGTYSKNLVHSAYLLALGLSAVEDASMSKVIRTGFAVLLFILSGGLTVAKRIADWVGRSTFVEDAEALGPKASKMFEWLAD